VKKNREGWKKERKATRMMRRRKRGRTMAVQKRTSEKGRYRMYRMVVKKMRRKNEFGLEEQN
jgi:hypothetical protein